MSVSSSERHSSHLQRWFYGEECTKEVRQDNTFRVPVHSYGEPGLVKPTFSIVFPLTTGPPHSSTPRRRTVSTNHRLHTHPPTAHTRPIRAPTFRSIIRLYLPLENTTNTRYREYSRITNTHIREWLWLCYLRECECQFSGKLIFANICSCNTQPKFQSSMVNLGLFNTSPLWNQNILHLHQLDL
jgi:hypothetical protein